MARNPAVPLFLLLLTIYVFSAGGHLYSVDELFYYSTTQALAEKWSMNIAYAIPLFHQLGFLREVPENVSVYYSSYGPLHAALAVPLYLVGAQLGVEPWRIVDLFYSPMVTAASAWLVYLISRRLDASQRVAVLLSLLYGLATVAWPYAKFFFDVTTASLMQLGAVYFLFDAKSQRRAVFLSGTFATLSIFARITQVITLPGMLIYLVFKGSRRRARIVNIGTFMVPVAVGGALYAFLNLVRYDSPLYLGANYSAVGNAILSSQLSGSLLVGVYGLLFSAGEGLFLFYPLCAVGLIELLAPNRDHIWERFIFGWLFFSSLLFFGGLVIWYGWAAWGTRYLVTSVPYLVLASLPLVKSIRVSISRTIVAVSAITVGVFSNLMGVLINFLYGFYYLVCMGGVGIAHPSCVGLQCLEAPAEIWIPSFSPLRASWDLIWSQTFPMVWFPTAPDIFYLKARFDLYLYDRLGVWALAITLILAFFEGVWLVRTISLEAD